MKVLFLTHNFPRHEGDAPGSFILRLATALRILEIVVGVAGQVESLEETEPGLRTLGLRHRHRPVEPHHGRTGQLLQLAVVSRDPRPRRVGRGCGNGVLCGDQCLQEVGRRRSRRQWREQADRLVDLIAVPSGTVLVGKQHQRGVAVHPRIAA